MALFYTCESCGSVMLAMGQNPAPCDKSGIKVLQHNQNTDKENAMKPRVSLENGKAVVRVGNGSHPATGADRVEWVYVETSSGGSFYNLSEGDEPVLTLGLEPAEIVEVYAYCGACGLWKADSPAVPTAFESNDVSCSPEFTLGCVNPSEN